MGPVRVLAHMQYLGSLIQTLGVVLLGLVRMKKSFLECKSKRPVRYRNRSKSNGISSGCVLSVIG